MTSERSIHSDEAVTVARTCAQRAAKYLRGISRSDIERSYKTGAHDIVTVHDRVVEDLVKSSIVKAYPEATIIGEESGITRGATSTDEAELRFYVDPIDGTSNFAAGLPTYAISIGVSCGNTLVGGVINAPLLDQEFWSDSTGAYFNSEVISGRQTRPAEDAVLLSVYPTVRDYCEFPELAVRTSQKLVESFGAVRSLGSAALELAYVAAGWADATMLVDIHPWDVAAGFHLLSQTGGSLRVWDDPLRGIFAHGVSQHAPAYVACCGSRRIGLLDQVANEVYDKRQVH